jgi:hypothetical protein
VLQAEVVEALSLLMSKVRARVRARVRALAAHEQG